GGLISVTLGSDRRPALVIVNDVIFAFSNYTATTVDIAVIGSDRQIGIQRGVTLSVSPLTSASLSMVRTLAASPTVRTTVSPSAQLFKTISCGLGVLAGFSVGTLPGVAAGIFYATAACGSDMVDVIAHAVDGDDAAIDASSGAVGSLPHTVCAAA